MKRLLRLHPGEWTHVATVIDGRPLCLFGVVNIWDCDWVDTPRKVTVRHPYYRQSHEFTVHEVTVKGKKHEFVAGEFSACVWGFYLRA